MPAANLSSPRLCCAELLFSVSPSHDQQRERKKNCKRSNQKYIRGMNRIKIKESSITSKSKYHQHQFNSLPQLPIPIPVYYHTQTNPNHHISNLQWSLSLTSALDPMAPAANRPIPAQLRPPSSMQRKLRIFSNPWTTPKSRLQSHRAPLAVSDGSHDSKINPFFII